MKQGKISNKISKSNKEISNDAKKRKYEQVIGKTFNELTILNITESRENSKLVWKCECLCSCGKKTNLKLRNVIYGRTKSCGHLRSEALKKDYSHLIGKTFGELTILSIIEDKGKLGGRRRCECLCSCGKKVRPRLYSVIQGNTNSCGHLIFKAKQDYSQFIGKTFGELTILSITKVKGKWGFVWRCECQCSCGKKTNPLATAVVNGYTKSCGHLRRKIDYNQLIGKTFNELTILKISKVEENSKTVRKCECLCSCGKKCFQNLYSVIHGSAKSCGHLASKPRRDYSQFIGKTFGELTILDVIKTKEKTRLVQRFECLCSCGKKTRPRATTVVNGYVTSCGHLTSKPKRDYSQFIGKTFGELTILDVMKTRKNSKILWECECLCSCGKKVKKRLNGVMRGNTKSCGHLVFGPKKDYSKFIGKTFGELTILDITRVKEKSGFVWRCECQCSCGKKTNPRLTGVLYGVTKSCGHLIMSRKKDPSEYIGRTYGELTILNIIEEEKNSKLFKKCECLCSCGKKTCHRLSNVLWGSTKSCGHLSNRLNGYKGNYSRFIGDKFGELTVLNVKEEKKNSTLVRKFECLCSCGKKVTKRSDYILYGKIKSCGHLKGVNLKKDFSNLIGKKFNRLTILDISEPMTKLKSQRICTCLCSCGRKVEKNLSLVIKGYTKSCGFCLKGVRLREKDCSYLIGQSIGKLTILSHADDPNAAKEKDNYLCRCSCGREVILPISEIVDGVITSCPECERKEKETEENTPTQKHGESLELGMRNIHWDEREQRFVVAIKRNGKWFKARAKTLEQAIEKREQKLREAEEFAKVSKFLKKLK